MGGTACAVPTRDTVPTRDVTIIFTDLVGSTELLSSLGEAHYPQRVFRIEGGMRR